MNLNMKITKVVVFLRDNGTDEIQICTELPYPTPCGKFDPGATFTCDCTRGDAVKWVQENLGVEPEVFNPFGRKA